MRGEEARQRLPKNCESVLGFLPQHFILQLVLSRRPDTEGFYGDAGFPDRGDFPADECVRGRRILAGEVSQPHLKGLCLGFSHALYTRERFASRR